MVQKVRGLTIGVQTTQKREEGRERRGRGLLYLSEEGDKKKKKGWRVGEGRERGV